MKFPLLGLFLFIILAHATFSQEKRILSEGGVVHHIYTPEEGLFWVYVFISSALCIFAGICSGLTVGLLSIDTLSLEINLHNGTQEEKRRALKILPILQQHHILLGTLLISNAFAMEALPIFLHKIVPAFLAIIISVVFVVIFGEVLPQAYCTGPDQLKIAEASTPLIKGLICLLYWIVYPLAKFLDWLLGVHGKTRFEKKDLKALIELHEVKKGHGHGHGHGIDKSTGLTADEITLITSTIDLRDIPITKIITPIEKVFMLSSKEKITPDLAKKIKHKGYTRIPLYEGNNKNQLAGILKAKSVIDCLDKHAGKSLIDVYSPQTPLIVSKDTNLLEMLMIFQDKRTTIAMVNDEERKQKKKEMHSSDHQFYSKRDLVVDGILNKHRLVGLLSLTDIFEELLKKDLGDDDIHQTLHSGFQKFSPSDKKALAFENSDPVERDFIKEPLLNKKR